MQSKTEIQAVIKEHGHDGYLKFQHDLLEGKRLPNGDVIKKNPNDFSIRALFEAMVGEVEDCLPSAGGRSGWLESDIRTEAVGTGSFASATGQLINAAVIQGYNAVPAVGDNLVTVMPSRLRDERIVGFTSLQGPKEVIEGEPYQDSEFEDKYVTTTQAKKGRILAITEELITFDQTGQVLMRASALGEATRAEREYTIIRGVADVDSGSRVYRPGGTAEQLYSAGNNNLLSTATPLNDWQDIQTVMAFHATNVTDDRAADDGSPGSGQPILWQPRQILVAVENAGVAARIVNAVTVGTAPGDTNTAAMNTGNPISAMIGGGLEVYASPYLDNATDGDQWDDASDWLIGDFRKQFVWKEIWPLQTLRAPANEPESFERDIVARFKVRYYGGINAIDERWVVQVNAA